MAGALGREMRNILSECVVREDGGVVTPPSHGLCLILLQGGGGVGTGGLQAGDNVSSACSVCGIDSIIAGNKQACAGTLV